MRLFDLEKNFVFYGSYHSNPINIMIHMIFVWPILFVTIMLLYFTPPIIGSIGQNFLVLNLGFLVTLIYSIFYVIMDKKAGSLAALMCFLSWIGSSFVSNYLGYSLAWKVVLATQLICWTGPFVGHGVFEKREPALLNNPAQAFLMAPFFVLLEALEYIFGYEPYPGFHERVQAKIDANIKEWKEKKLKKVS